jgi:8-oxo-dGTP pyrophosphatase MutT (NUDIX family)
MLNVAFDFVLVEVYPRSMLRFLRLGNWPPEKVHAEWTANTRRQWPEVESAIDRAWADALSRPGKYLFDGPMCRLESWRAADDRLDLLLSPSSYKPFLGTNMAHPEFADRFGPDVMANPVGVSPALLTADNFLLLGRRNAAVAYYPNRIHPFAGCLEPTDADVFAAIRRELHEELSLSPQEITDLRCTGIVEDLNLRQPELIFSATTIRTRTQIESRLDRTEHDAIQAIPATEAGIEAALAQRDELTPVAVAALLLWGRLRFSETWFAKSR